MWIFQLIRFPNLVIVALTQYLLYYLLLFPRFQEYEISPTLDPLHIFLFVLVTVIIAASGYIINDIIDLKIDLINKPDKTLINHTVSKSKAYLIYWITIIIGGILAAYLAVYVQQFPLFVIYPIAVFLLYAYSKYLKQGVLIGNLIVSLFCAFVAGIVWFAERASFGVLKSQAPEEAKLISFLFIGYLAFAFISTFYREIIKDLEDMEGDKASGCRTLPIVYGSKVAKTIAFIFGIILLLSITFFSFWLYLQSKVMSLSFAIGALLIPLIYSLRTLYKADSQKGFHHTSQIAKAIMVAGLILLIITIL